jgi:uncharacterized membrane protein
MGGLSIWHLIIVLVFLAIAAACVGLVVWLSTRSARRSTAENAVDGPHDSASAQPTESRLLQLDDLWAKGVITEAEYEQQRSAIIKGI